MSLITKQNQLDKICDLIRKHKIAAIDTEFIRETTYLPILCLIQINVDGQCYLVDTLSDLDLEPFFKILNNPKIIKIFHSARQDMEVLLINFPGQITPKAVFDTQIMAALCGLGYAIGYSNLVKNLLNKEVSKDWQRSDWQKRPLHPEQIEYAQIDVLYLSEIYQILHTLLKKQKKLSWAKEEMELNANKAIGDTDLCKNFSFSGKSLSYQENVMLLTKWRDDKARKHNIPRSFIFRDDVLEKIAFHSQDNLKYLEKYNFKTRISQSTTKQEITDLFTNKNALSAADFTRPKSASKLNEIQKELYQKSKILLQTQSTKHQVNPELIINQVNLQHLISGYKLVDEILFGWRYVVFGKELQRLVREN